jgi:hypothetical protein
VNNYLKWLLPTIVLIGSGIWYVMNRQHAVDISQPVAAVASSSSSTSSAVQYPVAVAETISLPSLDDSDAEMLSSLQMLLGDTVGKLLATPQLVRKIVATVDNLPRPNLAQQSRPLRAIDGRFQVTGSEDNLSIAPANYNRYAMVVGLAKQLDITVAAAWYRRYYPLFQQAYQNLGYPQGYFNDRLVEVIDNLLDTPEPAEPIHLRQPKVMYEFADATLESRSSGQKTLLRMGVDNARIIKEKLRKFRSLIVSGAALKKADPTQP